MQKPLIDPFRFSTCDNPPHGAYEQEQEQATTSGDRLRLSMSGRVHSALMRRRFDHTWVLRATDLRITLVMFVSEGVFA